MARNPHSGGRIVNQLRQAEVKLSDGGSEASVCELLEVTELPACLSDRRTALHTP